MLLEVLKPLSAITFAAKYSKIRQFRSSTCRIGRDVVYLKTFYLVFMRCSYTDYTAQHTSIGIPLVDLSFYLRGNRFTSPASDSTLGIKHVFGAFPLSNVNY